MKRRWFAAGFVAAAAMVLTAFAPAAYAGGPNLGKALGHIGKMRGLDLGKVGKIRGLDLGKVGKIRGLDLGRLGHHGRGGLGMLGDLGRNGNFRNFGKHGGLGGLGALGALGGWDRGGWNGFPYDGYRHHHDDDNDAALIAAGLAGVVLGGLGAYIAAEGQQPYGYGTPAYSAPAYAVPSAQAYSAPQYSAPQYSAPQAQGRWERREVVDQPARTEKQRVWIPETRDASGNKTGGGYYEMQTRVIPEQVHYEDVFVTQSPAAAP